MNIFIDSPLQEALYKDYINCAWDIYKRTGTQKGRIDISFIRDDYGRIPLSVAIIKRNGQFVELFIYKNYDCESSDDEGRTPFIYTCLANHIPWMVDIYQIYSLSNANRTDKYKNSGLTYAANNKRNDFCDDLFCNDIDIEKCNRNYYGIIKKKYNLIKRYKEAVSKAQSNFDSAQFQFEIAQYSTEKAEKRRKEINDNIEQINTECFN